MKRIRKIKKDYLLLVRLIRVLPRLQAAICVDPATYSVTACMDWPCQAERKKFECRKRVNFHCRENKTKSRILVIGQQASEILNKQDKPFLKPPLPMLVLSLTMASQYDNGGYRQDQEHLSTTQGRIKSL